MKAVDTSHMQRCGFCSALLSLILSFCSVYPSVSRVDIESKAFGETSQINNVDDFVYGQRLGNGATASVYISMHKATNTAFAVKMIDKSKTNIQRVQNEVAIHKSLRSVG